jgi:hypothetical protein
LCDKTGIGREPEPDNGLGKAPRKASRARPSIKVLPEPDRASLQERPCLARLEVVIEVFKIHFSRAKIDEFYAVAVIGGRCRGILGEHSRATTSKLFAALSARADFIALRFSLGSVPPRTLFVGAQNRQRAVGLANHVLWRFTEVVNVPA